MLAMAVHKVVSREAHPLGDIVRYERRECGACDVLPEQCSAFVRDAFARSLRIRSATRSRTEDIQRLTWRIYPYIAAELFLRWTEEDCPHVRDGCVELSSSSRV